MSVDSLVERWFPANEPAPHGEPVIAEYRAYNYPNGVVRQQVVWWREGEWYSYPSTDNRAYVDRWKQMPSAARITALEADNARLRGLTTLVAKILPSAAGLNGDPHSKIIACYMSLGELRAIRQALAAMEQADVDQ